MLWHQALVDGHEVGNHTYSHGEALKFNADQAVWENEIDLCAAVLERPVPDSAPYWMDDTTKGAGIPAAEIVGFRTPFLAYSDATFRAITAKGFLYDCSIEEGWQEEIDGTNFPWPYTLDHASPTDSLTALQSDPPRTPIGSHPGLWEASTEPVIVPPDDKCVEFGCTVGVRNRVHTVLSWFDVGSGKMTGLDWNLYYQYNLTKEEALASLKYTFSLRYNGNRSPMFFGCHTDEYSKQSAGGSIPYNERQWVNEQFINWVLTQPDVRVVPTRDIVLWCKNPVPLHDAIIDSSANGLSELVGSSDAAWSASGDNGGVIDTAGGLMQSGVATMGFSIPAQPDTNTWPGAYLYAGLPDFLSGATVIYLSYRSSGKVIVQLPTLGGNDPFTVTLPASADAFVTKKILIGSFTDPDWGRPGVLLLDSVAEITFSPEVPDATLPTAGTLEIQSLKIAGASWNGATALHQDLKTLPSDLSISLAGSAMSVRVPSAGRYTVDLFGIDGRRVLRLADGQFSAGTHSYALKAMTPGMYLARISGTAGTISSKVLLGR